MRKPKKSSPDRGRSLGSSLGHKGCQELCALQCTTESPTRRHNGQQTGISLLCARPSQHCPHTRQPQSGLSNNPNAQACRAMVYVSLMLCAQPRLGEAATHNSLSDPGRQSCHRLNCCQSPREKGSEFWKGFPCQVLLGPTRSAQHSLPNEKQPQQVPRQEANQKSDPHRKALRP